LWYSVAITKNGWDRTQAWIGIEALSVMRISECYGFRDCWNCIVCYSVGEPLHSCRQNITYAPDIRPFLYPASSRIQDLPCRISGRILDTENSRISGQIEEITISIHKISKNVFLKQLPGTGYCFDVKKSTGKTFISYFNRHLNVELKNLAGYPACTGYSLSGFYIDWPDIRCPPTKYSLELGFSVQMYCTVSQIYVSQIYV
jgi:hypothetical protein